MADKFTITRFKEKYETAIQNHCEREAFRLSNQFKFDAWYELEPPTNDEDTVQLGIYLTATETQIRTALYKQFGIEHLL